MNCILIILATIAFLGSIFNTTNLKQNSAEIQTIDIGSIAFYLRFLAIGEKSTTLELAFHNWGLALVSYLLSMLSFGILGIGFLCSAFFVAGMVFANTFNIFTFSFTTLEVVGMCLSVFGGLYVFNKRKKDEFSLRDVMIFSVKLICILAVIYFLAACIETNFIQNILKDYGN